MNKKTAKKEIKIKKNKGKGFTLVEILAILLILGIIITITIVVIVNTVDKTKEKAVDISEENIKQGALAYANEYKHQNKYWFIDEDSEGNEYEYVCTTIQMLIDTGYLDNDVIGLTLNNNNTIDSNTTVKISRDITTKSINAPTLEDINDFNCMDTSEINIDFEIAGDEGSNGWYVSDVTLTAIATNKNQIDSVQYNITGNNEETTTDGEIENDDWTENKTTMKISSEDRNIDVCLKVKNLKDQFKTFCLSDSKDKLKIDKTPPTYEETKIEPIQLLSKFKDNLTEDKDIDYEIIINETNTEGWIKPNSGIYATKSIESLPTGNLSVKVSARDEAGNESEERNGTIKIANSKNGLTSSDTEYYCSVTDESYVTAEEAENECIEPATVTTSTTYYCEENSSTYTNYSTAINNCKKYGTYFSWPGYYRCSSGTLNGTSCIDSIGITGTCECVQYPNGKYYEGNCTNWGEYYGSLGYNCNTRRTKAGCDTDTGPIGNGISNYAGTCTKSLGSATYISGGCSCTIDGKSKTLSSCSSSKCYEAGTIIINEKYICSLTGTEYSNESVAVNACVKKVDITEKIYYYCEFNNNSYSTQEEAQEACTNYCETGENYDNRCYQLLVD